MAFYSKHYFSKQFLKNLGFVSQKLNYVLNYWSNEFVALTKICETGSRTLL